MKVRTVPSLKARFLKKPAPPVAAYPGIRAYLLDAELEFPRFIHLPLRAPPSFKLD